MSERENILIRILKRLGVITEVEVSKGIAEALKQDMLDEIFGKEE